MFSTSDKNYRKIGLKRSEPGRSLPRKSSKFNGIGQVLADFSKFYAEMIDLPWKIVDKSGMITFRNFLESFGFSIELLLSLLYDYSMI